MIFLKQNAYFYALLILSSILFSFQAQAIRLSILNKSCCERAIEIYDMVELTRCRKGDLIPVPEYRVVLGSNESKNQLDIDLRDGTTYIVTSYMVDDPVTDGDVLKD